MKRATFAAAFLGCILAANYVTTEYGMVPVGFGLAATAGTYLAGLTFVLRDSLQDVIRASLPGRVVHIEPHPPHPVYGLTWRREWEPAPNWQVALPVVALIAVGAALSYLVSDPFIALASGVAFLVSELADLAVYTPLRKRGYVRAAIASNAVGAFVDTVLFLWIAGFPIVGAIAGQMVGKLAVTLVVVLAVAAVRARGAVTRPGEAIVLGFDGSKSDDATAIVAIRIENPPEREEGA